MRADMKRITIPAVLSGILLGLPGLPSVAAAQTTSPLPQAVGMGGSYVALARGFAAVAWNPAGLAMPDNPSFSLSLLPITVTTGVDPIGFSEFTGYDGQPIPHETRRRWLEEITAEGGESGAVGGQLSYLALSIGRFAFSATTSVDGEVNMAPDAAELVLFGNAGLTGEPRAYDLEGSRMDAAGTTTLAASTAIPLSLTLGPLPDQHFSIGATVKYTIGNFLFLARDEQSTLTSSPVEVDLEFPVVHTPLPDENGEGLGPEMLNNGSGWGLDLGAAWQGGIFSAAAVIRDVVNTFEWDADALEYSAGWAIVNADTADGDFNARDMENAPADLLERVDDGQFTYAPVFAAGAAARVLPSLTLTGEVRHAVKEGLAVGARNHMGAGAEFRLLPILPIRAGVALISGGYRYSGGLGLKLGPVELAAAAAVRQTELGEDAMGSAALTIGLP